MVDLYATLQQLKPLTDAIKIIWKAQQHQAGGPDYGWNKLSSIESYLDSQATALNEAVDQYFADEVQS